MLSAKRSLFVLRSVINDQPPVLPYKQTVGVSFAARPVKRADGTVAKLQLWDNAGDQKVRPWMARAIFVAGC